MFRQLLAAVASGLLGCSSSHAIAPEIAGEYCGAIDGGSFADSATYRLVLGKSGRGSLSLRAADGKKHVLRVRASDQADGSLLIGNGARISASLKVARDDEAGAILWGSLARNGLSHSIAAAKATAGGTATGRHTFVM